MAKLLVCEECRDIVALWWWERSCHCGKSRGRYTATQSHVVEIAGPCRVVGMPERLRYGTARIGTSWDCTDSANVRRRDQPGPFEKLSALQEK
jgi:hypothetical protein